jgi:hypothetical protein
MADHRTIQGSQDCHCINMHEEYGVAYATQYIQPVKITVPRF